MKISKQQLRQVIREEVRKTIEEQMDPSMGLSSVLSPWTGLWDRATNAFSQGLRNGTERYGSYAYNSNVSNSSNTSNQNINFTVNLKFKPETTENEIRRINFGEIIQNSIRDYLSQDILSGTVQNLRSRPEFSGQQEEAITNYANNMLQQLRNQVRVGTASSPRRDSNSILVALMFAASSSMLYLPENWNLDLQTRIRTALNASLPDKLIDRDPVVITWQTT